MEPLSVADYEQLARELLDPGRFAYFAGGAGDEWTLRENRAAYERWVLRPRVLVDVSGVSTETTLLGRTLAMPLLVAPVAYQRMAHADGEVGLARAAAAAGTAYTLSTMATATAAEVAAAAPGAALWFQLYVFKDEGISRALVEEARDAGFGALVLTVDTPRLGPREGQVRSGFRVTAPVPSLERALGHGPLTPQDHSRLFSDSTTWRDVDRFAALAGMPVVVKGISTAEDAILAIEHGAGAVGVSNHGGRQLDGVAATLDALPEVVDAVGGRVPVLVDGGIRRGTDVVKALGLGATAVLAGRAPVWGLAAGGEAGARRVLELLRDEIELALALVGAPTPAAVGRPMSDARRTALERAKARLDRLDLYPRPVGIRGVRLLVTPRLFRLPWFRRFDGYALHGTILLRSVALLEDDDLIAHELCHVWQLQHRPVAMPLSYLVSGYDRNAYEVEARGAVESTR